MFTSLKDEKHEIGYKSSAFYCEENLNEQFQDEIFMLTWESSINVNCLYYVLPVYTPAKRKSMIIFYSCCVLLIFYIFEGLMVSLLNFAHFKK